MLAVAILAFSFMIVGGAFAANYFRIQQTINTAQSMVVQDISQDGTFSGTAQSELADYLTSNGLTLDRVYFDASNSQAGYGSGGLQEQMGYDWVITKTPWNSPISVYIPASAPAVRSNYVPGAVSTDTSPASGGDFTGTDGVGGGGGTGTITSVATSITISGPPTALAGQSVTFSGTVSFSGSAAPDGTQVSVAGPPNGPSGVTTKGGSYSFSTVFSQPGTYQVSVSSGIAGAQTSITVTAGAPADISLLCPSQAEPGVQLDITGTVTDSSGNSVADGTQVTVSSNDSADIPNQTLTTSDGVFKLPVTFTSLGAYTVNFASGQANASASITVNPGPPKTVTLSASGGSGNPVTITAGQSVTFSGQVLGAGNTPVAQGTTVTVSSVNDGVDNLSPGGDISTDASGNWSDPSVELTMAGNLYFLAQTQSGVKSDPVEVVVNPAAPAKAVNLTAAPGQTEMGGNVAVSATIEDQYGNPVPGAAVVLSSPAVKAPVDVTASQDGAVTATVQFDAAGFDTLTLSSGGTSLGSIGVQVLPQGSYTLAASPATQTVTAGNGATVTFTLTDTNGNPVAGQIVTVSELPQGDGVLSATSGTTDQSGQFIVSLTPTQAGQAVVTAIAGGVAGTAVIDVNPAAPDTIDPPAMAPQVVQVMPPGNTYPYITGTILDKYGNIVPDAQITVTGGWSSTPTVGSTNALGQFDIQLTPQIVGGPYDPTVEVTDSQGGFTTTYTDPGSTLTVVAYAPSQLKVWAINGVQSVQVGQSVAIEAQLLDPQGNPIDAPVTFSTPDDTTAQLAAIAPSSPAGSGSGSLVQDTGTYDPGEAAVNVTFDKAGAQIVQVAYGTNTQAIGVEVTSNAVAQIAWNPVSSQVTAGQTLAVSGVALNSAGLPIASGTQVNLYLPGSNAPAATATTGGGGYFSANLVPTKAGSFYLMATADNQTFYGDGQVTVNPAAPAQLVNVTTNPGNILVAGTQVTITGQLVDQYGNAELSGITVTMSLPGADAQPLPSPSGTKLGGVVGGKFQAVSESSGLAVLPGPVISQTAQTQAGGQVSVNLRPTRSGTYNLQVSYGGTVNTTTTAITIRNGPAYDFRNPSTGPSGNVYAYFVDGYGNSVVNEQFTSLFSTTWNSIGTIGTTNASGYASASGTWSGYQSFNVVYTSSITIDQITVTWWDITYGTYPYPNTSGISITRNY